MIQERPERRARNVALVGVIFQILLVAFYTILATSSQSQAMWALTLLTGAGIIIWLTLLLVYHQRVLVQDETFESEQLKRERQGGGEAIFDVADESLLLARRRLRWMYRWLIPGACLVMILSLVLMALLKWSWKLHQPISATEWGTVSHSNMLMWFLGGAAFVSFLLSRYVVGMAKYQEWQMLRAGASYLMGVILGSVALAGMLGAIHFLENPYPEHVLAYILRILMLVLAGEFGLNLILDFYRPRGLDEVPRPSFDSRLLDLFTEPGGIARSIADAINYQFGFEVSSTWFYKLLERSAVPLIGFAVLTLLLASSIVFVNADEVVMVERFGKRILPDMEPGLHLKWPWPVDRIYSVNTRGIHEKMVGIKSEADTQADKDNLILWTNKHSQEPHLRVLVATPRLAEFMSSETKGVSTNPSNNELDNLARSTVTTQAAGIDRSEAVSVSMLRVAMTLHYQIKDAFHWITRYENPDKLLSTLAQRQIIEYFASADVSSILGAQRGPIERALKEKIQRLADEAGLSIEIVFLGLQGVHPPEEAAESFQDVIGAVQKRTATIRTAVADYNKKLSEVAGDVGRAEQLAKAITEMNRLDTDPEAAEPARQEARQKVQWLLLGHGPQRISPVGGKARSRLAQARAERWRMENEAHGKAALFAQELAIKKIAPKVYKARVYFREIAQAVKGIRKYVIATQDPKAARIFNLDVKDPMNAPLDVALESKP